MSGKVDVIVVGGGNAALCAALAAHEEGASVLVLERAPEEERGGNSTYTDGQMRCVYTGADDIIAASEDLTPEEIAISDFGSYTEEQFFDDMTRITQGRTDPDMCELLVKRSSDTIQWMRRQGVRFHPSYGRQAFKVNGRFKFFGGSTLIVREGGVGLVNFLYRGAQKKGIEVRYNAWVRDLLHTDGAVTGVVARIGGVTQKIEAGAVVLACGGFEANTEWRSRHLGRGWDLAKVRGSRFNTGDGLSMALNLGAQPYGHWSGCHAVGWERYATDFGDPNLTPTFQRHSYPLCVMVNSEGRRFLDEGADFRNYTYAKYGHIILDQPGQFAWQVYDAKVLPMLRSEYHTRSVTKVRADTIEELVEKMGDVDRAGFLRTISDYNASVKRDVAFDPNIKDGKCTVGLDVPKSNWAQTIDTAPFEAYAITCGVTFTFGGLRVTTEAQVVDTSHDTMTGLFAAGEMVGGLFYFNYPGSTGLTSGAVFGRIAGRSAAIQAKARRG
jgi:tricarballylate dehydrogenase